jgi:aminomethyltransferase
VDIKKTGFYDIHRQLGAKLVDFAGYYMPIQYRGIIDEHRRVRSTVGLFDVSHMGEFYVSGANAEKFLQNVTINDVSKLAVNQVQYSAMCYEDGGIVDDLLVYRMADKFLLVVNASNLEKDWNWLSDHLIADVRMENRSDDCSLLALQGPDSFAVLQKLTKADLAAIPFYWLTETQVAGIQMMVSRTGYTGEKGFELCFPVEHSIVVWNAIMEAGKPYQIEPIGLGARDTLRLEMKYCLYGNDIDATTNPLEAGLGWITKLNKGEFIARPALVKVKEQGVSRKLVGFEMDSKAFPRHGYAIWAGDTQVGQVTSGTFSPILEKGIGTGYVPANLAAIGTPLAIEIRTTRVPARVCNTPFVSSSPQ